MKKTLEFFLTVLCAISLFVIIGFTSVETFCYSDSFYFKQYEKNNVAESTHINNDDLHVITDAIQDYIKGDREDLVVHASVNGVYREVFNEDEKAHMYDVQRVFLGFSVCRSICVIVLAVVTLTAALKNISISVMFKNSSIWVLAFCFIAGLGVTLFFDETFALFHTFFFVGDTWLFDARISLLVNILTEEFFVVCAIRTVATLISVLVVLIVFNILLIKSKGVNFEH